MTVPTARAGPVPVGDDPIEVIGGAPADLSGAPWQVALLRAGAGAQDAQFCGGSLVAPKWVLTAAHCVDDRTAVSMDVGHGRARLSAITSADRTRVTRIIIHPQYRSLSSRNDFALLELARAATGVTPIGLWTDAGPAADTPARISGWGSTQYPGASYPDRLQMATVQVLAGPQEQCGSYGDVFRPSIMLCAGSPSGTPDTCFGDSGGPLAIRRAGQWVLAGVTSFGVDCARRRYPGVYARVSAAASWIAAWTATTAPPTVIRSLVATGLEGSVRLSWEPPATGAAPTNYAVNYRETGAGSWQWFNDGFSTTPVATVDGLAGGRSYDFRVRAKSTAGAGPWSEVVTATPEGIDPSGAPDKPRQLRATARARRVALRWKTPLGAAVVTDYVVQYREYRVGRWRPFRDGISTEPSVKITGLKRATPYQFRVAARNGSGRGPWAWVRAETT